MTHRIHDLASLREDIKPNATRARELRQEARETSGLDRHALKVEAKGYGEGTRHPTLALGYLRGRTIAQMESEYTRPDNQPSSSAILSLCQDAWLKGPDAASLETSPSWEDFKKAVEADLKAWRAHCLAQTAMKQALRTAKRGAA